MLPRHAGDVDRPPPATTRQAPCRSDSGNGEPPHRPASRFGHRARIPNDDQVDVEHRPPQQHVAHAATDQPCALRPAPAGGCLRADQPSTMTCSTRRRLGAMSHTISYAIVSLRAAHSSAPIRSSPSLPISTTGSPSSTSQRSPITKVS